MKRKLFLIRIALIALSPLFFISCKEENKKQVATKEAKKTYTCPMHPQIVQDKPGTCPICGMDLVPFDRTNQQPFLTLGESQIALANISTITIGDTGLSNTKQFNGRLVINPEQTEFVSSRVAGRVEQLFVRQTGEKITKGQPLYKIYSEQLAALQQEYLVAVAQVKQFPDNARFADIEKAAKQKLLLYGQTEAQLQQLIKDQETDPYVTYYAPANGTVAELNVSEGQYVSEGGPVMRLESYDRLWVEADVYPSDASLIKTGQQVKVVMPGWEDQLQTMTIQFINPALETGRQLMQVRGTIPNPNNQWQPGLQANILLPVKAAGKVLSLPVDAVIRDGSKTHVWIAMDSGRFEPRMVKTGLEDFDKVEITEGLAVGDHVVITGAYLLYSEFVLKKGGDVMAGHNHN